MGVTPPSGKYPIASTDSDEVRRLKLQHDAWRDAAEWLLDTIEVQPGWRCLDLGSGPEGLTNMLSERVGPSGHVTGLDFREDFIALGRANAPDNVDFIQGDAYATGLPDASFDLVHMRFLASTAGGGEVLAEEAERLLRPGGVLVTQEADGRSLSCHPPHESFTALFEPFSTLFPWAFGDHLLAYELFRILRGLNFEDVGFRPHVVGTHAQHPWWDYLPATAESVRATLVDLGAFSESELNRTIAACRHHLSDPNTTSTSVTLVQTWGRKGGG